ncbi:hypothetical protein M9H77_14435 [Catharanthus roseus]|uniref:Uncharacterized protein n=1 Tax=Catharanthus roseus TaxID=4058 RepID=A0ACC0BN17_CATRO|nr:hypothetical protein M9H77_14435 [Catharanthus roseus]
MSNLYIARSGVVSQLPKTLSMANFRAYMPACMYSPFETIPALLNNVRHRIYRVQGSLELSFFRVIVIIRFKLTRNDIISVQSVNLIVVVIDVTVQHRRYARIQQEYESLPLLGGVE